MDFSVVFHDHIKSSIDRILRETIIPKSVIEIGVFEGQTTVNLANLLLQHTPQLKYYAIDPFLASENLVQEVVDAAKQKFVTNIKSVPSVEFINKTSLQGLLELHQRNVTVDFIYVDGSHFAKDVLCDAVLGFELLNKDGVMLFDDAVSWRYGTKIQDSPKIAIDGFIASNWDRLKVLEMPNGYQVAIQKTN
jgi:predicted O-methyltransferase YrrM